MTSRIFKAALCACAATLGAASLHAQEAPVSFAVVGDTGYIPSYEQFDEDEAPLRTFGEYMAAEVAEWLDANPDLTGFRPTPWTYETALGSFMPQSGMHPVAQATSEICEKKGCNFATMMGDNIYPDGATLGADGVSDARRFSQMLDKPYGKLGQGTPGFTIYTMMGNHDWHISREATMAQMEYLQQHPNFTMPGLFYRAVPEGLDGEVEIFVIDTEMLLASTTVYRDRLDAEGNEIRDGRLDTWDDFVKPANEAERNMVPWLEDALASSTARWKIVLGHHALWSSGGSKYEKAHALKKLLLPALCRHADAYFAGDDHLMEAYTDDCSGVEDALDKPLPMFVAGAGSKYRPQHKLFAEKQIAKYPQMTNLFSKGNTWGFLHVTMQNDQLATSIYTTPSDMSGRPIEEATFSFPRRNR